MEQRLVNDALADILGPAVKSAGYTGDGSIERLAGLLERRLGYKVAVSTLRSYINGHRTPPLPALVALCEQLDLKEPDRLAALGAASEHQRRQRAAQVGGNRAGNDTDDAT